MISFQKIANGVLKFLGKIKEIWVKFWNDLLVSVKRIFNQVAERFHEKVAGISLSIYKKDNKFKRGNSVYTETSEGYRRRDIFTAVDENEVPEELRGLSEGQSKDLTQDFDDVLVLEY